MVPDHQKYILYIDDTGSRDLEKSSSPRTDDMDWFGLGGILVKGEEDKSIYLAHTDFCASWDIDYPLHSAKIRGRRGKFGWLSEPEKSGYFMPELRGFIMAQPFLAIAAVIDRPGYFNRYQETHSDNLWQMDKTAFSILVERAAKFARYHGRKLQIVYEESGKREDRALVEYTRKLKLIGSPFDPGRMANYQPLSSEDYKNVILGEPRRKKKSLPQLQLADLVLFPIAKGIYQKDYRPYLDLKRAGKLIDDNLPAELRSTCCIKYSCFDRL
jgi:hypothetical protein